MTEKELLYIDDTLGHLTNTEDFLDAYLASVEDENFKTVLEDLSKLNRETYKKFYKFLGE